MSRIFAALVFSGLGIVSSHSETIKRDIHGFHPGTVQEFRDAAKAFNCTGVWVLPSSSAANPGALCEYRFNSPPYTGRVTGQVGTKTQKIIWVSENFQAGAPEDVARDVCRQFSTDCSSAKLASPIDLGNGDLLIVRKNYTENARNPIQPGQPLEFQIILANQNLSDEENDAVDPSFNKQVPKF
jgi:hypothetical protein